MVTTRPLGIDIGRTRIRVALAADAERPRLVAVASRARDGELADDLAAAIAELATRERRCVFALDDDDAALAPRSFPPRLTARERERAARYDIAAERGEPVDAAVITLRRLEAHRWLRAAARPAALRRIAELARRLRLRIEAVDYAAFAYARALPGAVVVDVGRDTTRLYVPGEIPVTRVIPGGGGMLTAAIARAFAISAERAEERKQALGLAGAGEREREELAAAVGAALVALRAEGVPLAAGVTLAGNGARAEGLLDAIERTGAVRAELASLAHVPAAAPPDVLRAAGPDWALAYGLACWQPG